MPRAMVNASRTASVPPPPQHTPRSLRVRLGLTQIQLEERSGVTARTIGCFEDGDDVSLDTLRSLAPALEVDVATLITALDTERALRARRGSR